MLPAALLPLLTTAALTAAQPTMLYVAPTGADTNPGTKAAPRASLAGARDAVRKLAAAGLPAAGVTVEFAAGDYEQSVPVEFGQGDSGTAEKPILYRAAPGAAVRLIGGKVVTGWQSITDQQMRRRLTPEVRDQVHWADLKALGVTDLGGVIDNRLELFYNDQPTTLARWPNQGFVTIKEEAGGEKFDVRGRKGDRAGKFVYDGDRPYRWTAESDIWLHGYWFWDWADERQKVKSIDLQQHVITLEPPDHHYGYRKGQWYYALNVFAELDEPGEWYLDRETSRLYFYPPTPLADGRAVISVSPSLMALKDVSHVTFRGFTMEAFRGTGLTISGGMGDRVVASVIRNGGGSAVSISGGANHGVVGCDIYGVGDSGVHLNGGERQTLTPCGHFADNNHIHDYGRWKRMYSRAISLSGVGCKATHNLLDNAPHQAISFGGNDHLMQYNEIHSVCYESNDAGAIYSGRDWTMRGTVIRDNYLHDISGFRGRGCVGVYLDDMYCGTQIEDNLFVNVTRAAMIGGGRDNTIVNNVFIDCKPSVHLDNRAMGWAAGSVPTTMTTRLKAMPYQDPLWRKTYPRLVNILDDEPAAPKGNLIARNISVGGKWDGMQAASKKFSTIEHNLVDEDPKFVDAEHGDYRLQPDSPALKLGFKPLQFDQMGLYESPDRASWPVESVVRPKDEPAVAAAPQTVKKGKPPVYQVARTGTAPTIDGDLKPAEWAGAKPETAMLLATTVNALKSSTISRAWFSSDADHLYVAVDNTVLAEPKLRVGHQWGQDDAVELAFRTSEKGPILVLRGFADGTFVSSDEAGAPEAAVKQAAQGVVYRCRINGATDWTTEWRIPFGSLGWDPTKVRGVAFSLSVRKTADNLWLQWEPTLAASWEVAQAGFLELPQ